ncbi:uncharacterized protein LOC108737605 [Agrilus planipennis]|uniref:Uncharacterized protein LOC108737605 n=1 Tax=Agrilus planipennis TaxID=224129 RepID=A0A7F5RD24_AGRPL|nr:uncharacterized protein LOC112905511 [Agrilus planipennis]XP_025833881.1 uncharacterized protein LOC108737605 [Agrilus planipennis]
MIKSIYVLLIFNSLLWGAQTGLVKVPKVYNAIVSSKQNLSPSQAIPVIEPVYRTSALGVLFPPAIIHTVGHPLHVSVNRHANEHSDERTQTGSKEIKGSYHEIKYHGSLYPVAVDPYYAYSYHNNLLVPTLPIYQQPFIPPNIPKPTEVQEEKRVEEATQHKVKAAIDFQKNPEVPDVPTPPLPVRNKTPTSQ